MAIRLVVALTIALSSIILLKKLNMDTIYKDIFSMIGSLGLAKAYGI